MDENQLESDKSRLEDEKDPMDLGLEERFGWFLILNRVCNDDITRHKEVIEKTIIEVLNQLSFIIQKEAEEIKRQKRAAGHLI